MKVFDLEGKLKIDGIENAGKQVTGLQAKVQNMAKGLRIAGAAMTAIGAVVTGMATKSVMDFAKMGDEVHKMSLRTGFATETLSRLKYAAAIGGASLGDVEKAAKRMATTILDAKDGLAETVRQLDRLGIEVEDFEGLKPEEQFMLLAGALSDVEDASERAAIAQKVFGRAGTALLPMLADGTSGLKAMMDEAGTFTKIFGKDAAEAAANLTDGMGRLKGTMDKVKLTIAEKLVPVLIPLIEKITAVVNKVSTWMDANPALARTITIISVAVGGILLVLGPLLIMLPFLVAGLPLLGAAFAVLLGPVGLVIAAIVALIAIGILIWKNWDTISAKATEIWGGISSFFSSVWEKIKIIFSGAFEFIKDLFFKYHPIGIIISQWDEIIAFFKGIPAKIGAAFSGLKDVILAPFQAAWKGIGAGINWVIDQLNRISFTLPSWIPLIGGKTFGINIPNITLPSFKQGGTVPGPIGQPVPIMAHGGEQFLGAGAKGGVTVNIYPRNLLGTKDELVRYIKEALLVDGGSNVSLGFT